MSIKAHYFSGTHWDREWYRPFQEFRFLLVEVLDNLIDLMEKDRNFKYFHLDGQTCILKDYLEIRPEKKEQLAKLIQSGKILIGPWFTMPDLFTVGDESIIRNLLLGKSISEKWGTKPMPVGYVCDMFGHPSQMPQIFSGFDYKYCVLGRGTIESETPAFFEWKAKNESKIFVFKLQDEMGYGAFIVARNKLEAIKNSDKEESKKIAIESIRKYINHEISRTNGDVVCLFDSMDHMPPATDTQKYIEIIKEACPDIEVKHSNLVDFFTEAKNSSRDVPTFAGELRRPSENLSPYNWLIPNCTSSRIRLKQKNDICQNILFNWVEPFVFFANSEGANINYEFLRNAWENLLLNHAHDSICGCSIDQVHKDMDYRFDQVQILGELLKNRSIGFLTSKLKELGKEENEFTLVIGNASTSKHKDIINFYIDFPKDYQAVYTEGFGGFGAQKVNSFTLHKPDGTEIKYQKLSIMPNYLNRTRYALTTTEAGDGVCSRYFVAAEIELPAMGFTTVLVKPSKMPIRNFGSQLNSPLEAENEHLIIKINNNGTLDLFDKNSNEWYKNLLIFEDKSEIGNGWMHSFTINDELISSFGSNVNISIVEDGEFQTTFKILTFLKLPCNYDYQKEKRSEILTDLQIENFITLKKNCKYLEIKTIIDNNIEDHLLRLLFPTEINDVETYTAHSIFDLVERTIKLDEKTSRWQEVELTQKPFQNFLAVNNSKRGLAFISSYGIHEGGVRDDRSRTIDITLFRSFRRTVGTTGESDGLEKGKIEFKYAILPFSKELPHKEIFNIVSKLKNGVFVRQTGKISSGFPNLSGKDLNEFSLFNFEENNLIISAFKQSEDGKGAIIRLWNPTDSIKTEKIHFYKKMSDFKLTNLAEEEIEKESKVSLNNNKLVISSQPFEILSIKLFFE